MKKNIFIVFSSISFLGGLFFFAYLQEWIVLRLNHTHITSINQELSQTIKKKVKLIFWRHNKWNTEYQELLWPGNSADKLYYVINSWLTLLDQETIMDKKVTLQTAILSMNGKEAYISFDRNPLPTQTSTLETWMWIESLLKTIRDNEIPVDSVRFLVHHQPLIDDHLDFTNSWPIRGFLEQ